MPSYKELAWPGLGLRSMELLKEPPPAFDSAARLFDMARLLPASRRLDVRIGLACGGKLFAHCNLDGYRQVNFLAEHLRHQGWREHLLGAGDEMFDCDMLFSWPSGVAGPEEDPSFIRRAAVNRYG